MHTFRLTYDGATRQWKGGRESSVKAIFPPQEIGETLGRHKNDSGEGEGGAEELRAE